MQTKKFLARDCELSTTGQQANGRPLDGWSVTRTLLAQLPTALADTGASVWSLNDRYASAHSMDCLRRWTSGGQCYYADMSHFEACSAEALSPRAFAAQSFSLLRAAERARVRAEQDDDQRGATFALSAANVDIQDPAISWGSHLNVSVSNELWDDLFLNHHHPARLGFVASAVAAGIAFFGSGYLMPLKDGSAVYSLSARAHHLAFVKTLSTTEAFRRGILNTRHEPHGELARLHLIGFDFALISAALLASYVQCSLAAAEEGYCDLILYDPVQALRTWSWNLNLETGKLPATAALIDGRKLTLPAYVRELTCRLLRMCEGGLLTDDVVPEAKDLLPRILDLTEHLERGDISQAARHLDWAAKLLVLKAGQQPLESHSARLVDHDFTNTDHQRGAIWRLWESRFVDPLVKLEDADAALVNPPVDSRAWGRGMLIRRFHPHITDIDWGCVELKTSGDRWSERLKVEMPRIDEFTQEDFGPLLDQSPSLQQLNERLTDNSRSLKARRSDPQIDIVSELATARVTDDAS
jgi:hypothetical protein